MRFERVEIQNFLSLSEAALTFPDGVHLITGRNHDMASDEDESNGSGKSSLFEAIHWCLYGTLSRGLEKQDSVVNKVVGKDCLVHVTFTYNQKRWDITRTRQHSEFGNSLSWLIDGKELAKHELTAAKQELSSMLPVSEKVFRHAIQVGQGMPDRFLSLGETEKQDLLCEIIDLEVYDRAQQRAKDKLDEVSTELRVTEELLSSLKKQLDDWHSRQVAHSGEKEEFVLRNKQQVVDAGAAISTSERQIADLTSRKEALVARAQEEEALANQWREHKDAELSKERTLRDEQAAALREKQAEASRAESEWNTYLQQMFEASTTLAASVSAAMSKAQLKQDEAKNLASGACEFCGQDLGQLLEPKRKSIEAEAAQLLEDWRERDREYKEHSKEHESRKAEAAAAKEQWNTYLESLSQQHKAELESGSQELDRIIAQSDAAYSKAVVTRQEASSLEPQIAGLRQRKETAQKNLAAYETDLARFEERIKAAQTSIDELLNQIPLEEDKVEGLETMRDHWKYWKDNIPNLRAAAMADVLAYLNSRIEEYMRIFSGGSMKMELYQREWGKGSRIKVDLWTPGGTYALSSGGERRRVDLALYLALSDLLQVSSGVTPNIMVCDEIMDGLSPAGVRKFLEVLRTKADAGMCIFVITHNPSVAQVYDFDSIVTVNKTAGKAYLA